MNIARFSVTRPVAVTMRIAALVLLGAICLTRLPIDLLPKVSFPTVAVVVTWPNVAPEEIEAQVTRPIEQAVSSVPNLYSVTSNTSEGTTTVRVQFQWGTDIGQGAVDVMQLVARARQRMPTDPTLQQPVVYKYDPTQLPIMIFGVSGDPDPVKLRTLIDNQISPMIESAEGVGAAVVTGGQQRAILVEVDPAKLRAHNLTLAQVNKRIAEENLNLPAGIVRESNTEFTTRSLGWFTSPKQIERIPVGAFNGRVIALSEVAEVRDSHPETRIYTRLNGQPAVGIIITKQSAANTVGTAQAVLKKIAEINKQYPNLKFGLAYDQSQFIAGSIHDVQESALIGGALAILILLFFLRNFRSTFVVALSIPISIISTFGLLYMCGFTLNTMTLGGLALATGLIVDDAVVVLENIFRHMERDKKRAAEASVSGTSEIMAAVVASTLTVIIVFLPLLFIRGQAGQMFTQFALVVIFSILVSLLDAVTVVPMLASRMISGEAHHELMVAEKSQNLTDRIFRSFGRTLESMDAAYRRGLHWCLRRRTLVMSGAVLSVVAILPLLPLLGTELMPQTDSGDFTVRVKMPPGTALETTNAMMQEIEGILSANPNVATVFSAAGTTLNLRGTTSGMTAFEGSATVKLKEERTQTTAEVLTDLRKQFAALPGVKALPNQFDLVTMVMTGRNQNVEINLFGDDLAKLYSTAKEVMGKMKAIQGLENVDLGWQESMPEYQWEIDRDKAQQFGLSFQDVATAISTATNGSIASYYQESGYQYPILVQLPEAQRKTISDLMSLPLRPTTIGNPTAAAITLDQVARAKPGVGPSEISRQDRQRMISISGLPQGRSTGEIQKDIETMMSSTKLPQGYRWDWGQDMQRRSREYGDMTLAVLLAIGLIYMLLASQFESFIHPLTVLVSVPLSAIGVVLALFISGKAFGLTAFIGLLMLVGIVVKNGILLVDYTNVLRGRGYSRDEAVLTAGPTRLRPILMTSSAAILGMMPLAIGLGRGSETQSPMATAVIGGLFTSTLLTLFIVPTVYTLFDDLARKLRRDKLDLAHAGLVGPSVESVGRTPDPDSLLNPPPTSLSTPPERIDKT